jgi:hypothetical protein
MDLSTVTCMRVWRYGYKLPNTYAYVYMHTAFISTSEYNLCRPRRACYQTVAFLTAICRPRSSYSHCQMLCQVSGVMRLWCSGRRHPRWSGVLVGGLRHKYKWRIEYYRLIIFVETPLKWQISISKCTFTPECNKFNSKPSVGEEGRWIIDVHVTALCRIGHVRIRQIERVRITSGKVVDITYSERVLPLVIQHAKLLPILFCYLWPV